MISPEKIVEFEEKGFIVLDSFYNYKDDIVPILRDIHGIVNELLQKYGLENERREFTPEQFDAGYMELILANRRYGGEVYDAVKQLPSFVRLCSKNENVEVFNLLRGSRLVGLAGGGAGIRINNPAEHKYRAEWHQDYSSQLRSPDGIVFWSPLITVSEAHGPVEFCVASHLDGVADVDVDKGSTYHLRIADEEQLSGYEWESPLSKPGDLVLIDFLTIHRSGFNVSDKALWSMQYRFFNFRNEIGQKNCWCGAFANGVDFEKIHPEFVRSIK